MRSEGTLRSAFPLAGRPTHAQPHGNCPYVIEADAAWRAQLRHLLATLNDHIVFSRREVTATRRTS